MSETPRKQAWRARFDDERGAALVEYGFLVALIAVVCLVAISFVGVATNSNFESSRSSIEFIDAP